MPRAITMQPIEGGKPGKVYYPLRIREVPAPTLGPHDLEVRMSAAALNHRDLFLRQHLYPAPSFEVPLLADGCGVVTGAGASAPRSWLGKRVVLMPSRGWQSAATGPESLSGVAILGGTRTMELGTAQEVLTVHADEVEEAPAHLSTVEAAALPLTGLTAWRALVTKSGNAEPGRNILVTGIGGGVALNVLQFAVAMGVNAYVTSGDEAKLDRARQLGARGGANYKTDGWEKAFKLQLPSERPYLDAIIDGAGGGIISKAVRLLKPGGVIVQYGMTTSPKMDWTMPAVLSNLELRGTTMGSRQEFRDMMAFVRASAAEPSGKTETGPIRPVISRVVRGFANLEGIDALFEDMRAGRQFGKLVVEFAAEAAAGEGGDSGRGGAEREDGEEGHSGGAGDAGREGEGGAAGAGANSRL